MLSQHTQEALDLLYHREREIGVSLMQFIHLLHHLISLVRIILREYDNLTLWTSSIDNVAAISLASSKSSWVTSKSFSNPPPSSYASCELGSESSRDYKVSD